VLEVDKIEVSYGKIPVIQDVSFKVQKGEIVSIIGSNGSGKSTILKTISGLLHPKSGKISFLNERIDKYQAYYIAEKGISLVPEGGHIFGELTISDNLLLGAYKEKDENKIKESFEEIYKIFPFLKERKNYKANTLSGGERQMLAIARGLMSRPKLLMLDEPSLGLAPKIVESIFKTVKEINRQGTTILLVEQQVQHALELADRAYVLETGKIILEDKGNELLKSAVVKKAYLGM